METAIKTPAKLLVGQNLIVFAIVLMGVWFATEWSAAELGFQPQLGSPRFVLSSGLSPLAALRVVVLVRRLGAGDLQQSRRDSGFGRPCRLHRRDPRQHPAYHHSLSQMADSRHRPQGPRAAALSGAGLTEGIIFELKLAKLPDRTPVRITVTFSPELNQAFRQCAGLLCRLWRESAADLITFMLDAVLDSDKASPKHGRKRQGESDYEKGDWI